MNEVRCNKVKVKWEREMERTKPKSGPFRKTN